MAKFVIEGGMKLSGSIEPIGNKNAILKMIPASLLTMEPVTLTNVPAISDVKIMIKIMEKVGSTVKYDEKKGVLVLHTPKITHTGIDSIEAKKIRASNMFLGPILARMGEVTSTMPGGDKIGPREMNAHFDGFNQLGARVTHNKDESFTLKGKLDGKEIFLYEPSVTATENVILASVLAKGQTTLLNAASEPHVQELCKMLNQMGAKITGIGTNQLAVEGVAKLNGATYKVPPDYIYIGTMIVLAVITGGEITIKNVIYDDLRSILYFFEKLGVKTIKKGNNLVVPKNQKMKIQDEIWARSKGVYCQPWPCFPTDMMSLAIVLATQIKGSLLFFEKMYSGRMFFADYLNGMRANIIIADPHRVVVNGKTKLKGVTVFATDLRAGMAYVAAGLCAEGKTIVENIEHIERGYPRMDDVLKNLGAEIRRLED